MLLLRALLVCLLLLLVHAAFVFSWSEEGAASPTGEGWDGTLTTTGDGSNGGITATGESSNGTLTTTDEGSNSAITTTGESSNDTITTTDEGSNSAITTTDEGSNSAITTTGESSNDTITTTDEGSNSAITTTLQLSTTGNLSQLGAVKRRQRQIRFKSSYQELPTGLQGTTPSGGDLEGLSYFIQVDVDDPPASTALTRLPEGTRTYFLPQVPQPEVSMRQEEHPDEDTTTSFSEVPFDSKGEVKSLVKTSARLKTDISPQSMALDINSIHSMDLSKLVTSPETSPQLTSSPSEPPTTYKPNFIVKGISVSSRYASYWPADSRPKQNHSSRHHYQVSPSHSSTPPNFGKSISSISRSISSSPQDSPLTSKYVSSYSTASLFSTQSPLTTQLPSRYLTSVSSAGAPHPVATTWRSVSNLQVTTPTSTPSRVLATEPRILSKFSLPTTFPFLSSTSKSITTSPFVLSTTEISVSSKSFSSNSFTTVPSVSFSKSESSSTKSVSSSTKSVSSSTKPVSSSTKSVSSSSKPVSSSTKPVSSSSKPVSSSSKPVSSYSSIQAPPSEAYSLLSTTSVPSKSKQFTNRIKNRPLPLTFGSKTNLGSTPSSFKSLSQVTPSPGLLFLTSTIQPKYSPSRPKVRTKVYPSTHVPNPSPSRLSAEKSQTLTKTLIKGSRGGSDPPVAPKSTTTTFTNVQTFTKRRPRPLPKSVNAVRQQSKARTKSKTLSRNSTNTLQSFTAPRQHTGYSDSGGGRRISGLQTPVSDGKTLTVDSSDDPYTGSIPGRGGIDYPILQDIPKTGFECSTKPAGGYYADQEANCQVFHVCWEDRRASFLCPVGTIFNQQLLVCDWWHNVDCSATETFIQANTAIWSPSTYPNHL